MLHAEIKHLFADTWVIGQNTVQIDRNVRINYFGIYLFQLSHMYIWVQPSASSIFYKTCLFLKYYVQINNAIDFLNLCYRIDITIRLFKKILEFREAFVTLLNLIFTLSSDISTI